MSKFRDLGLGKRCFDLVKSGLSYDDIAERVGLRTRGQVAGYVYRYRKSQGIKPPEIDRKLHAKAVAAGMKKAEAKRKQEGKTKNKFVRETALMPPGHTDLISYVREDGVRITRDTKPRVAYGCGFDWKGI